MLKYLVLLICFLTCNLCFATDYITSLHRKLTSLPDKTLQVQLKLNSLPDADQKILSNYAFKHKITQPFIIKQLHGVYIANPSKISGYFWWKRIAVLYLKKSSWESFINNPHVVLSPDAESELSLIQGFL